MRLADIDWMEAFQAGSAVNNRTSSIEDAASGYSAFKAGLVISTFVSPVLFLVGFCGNTLSFIVMLLKHNRKLACCVYLAGLAISDTITVSSIFHLWIITVLQARSGTDLECKVIAYFFHMGASASTFTIIAVTLDRFLATCMPLKSIKMRTRRRVFIAEVIIFVVASLVCIPFGFNARFVSKSVCSGLNGYNSVVMEFYAIAAAILLSVIPFVVILIMNIAIIQRISQLQRRRTSGGGGSIQEKLKNAFKRASSYKLQSTAPHGMNTNNDIKEINTNNQPVFSLPQSQSYNEASETCNSRSESFVSESPQLLKSAALSKSQCPTHTLDTPTLEHSRLEVNKLGIGDTPDMNHGHLYDQRTGAFSRCQCPTHNLDTPTLEHGILDVNQLGSGDTPDKNHGPVYDIPQVDKGADISNHDDIAASDNNHTDLCTPHQSCSEHQAYCNISLNGIRFSSVQKRVAADMSGKPSIEYICIDNKGDITKAGDHYKQALQSQDQPGGHLLKCNCPVDNKTEVLLSAVSLSDITVELGHRTSLGPQSGNNQYKTPSTGLKDNRNLATQSCPLSATAVGVDSVVKLRKRALNYNNPVQSNPSIPQSNAQTDSTAMRQRAPAAVNHGDSSLTRKVLKLAPDKQESAADAECTDSAGVVHKTAARSPASNSSAVHHGRRGSRLFSAMKRLRSRTNSDTRRLDKQLSRVLLLVSFTFLFLTLPQFVRYTVYTFKDVQATPAAFATFFLFYHVSQKLYVANSAINFVLYCIGTTRFRQDTRRLLCACWRCVDGKSKE